MKKIKQIISIVVALALLLSNVTFAVDLDTNITITSNVEPTDVNREFQVTYNMSVDATTNLEAPAVVLAIDRSGSMLFSDGAGHLVVDRVRVAVERFVTQFYINNPGGDLAIVSFGTGAVAHDNFKYNNTAEAAMNAFRFTYAYRYDYRYHSYQWDNWGTNQNYTNIGEAFEQSAKTVELAKKTNQDTNDVIILFSDGVPTTFKSSNDPNSKTGSYPTEDNQSTVYSYTEGQNAQAWADVITVGYFGAYNNYPLTKAVAQSTLERAQNVGFYTTDELDQVDDLFETVLSSIEYLGTDSKITEVV
ncbi:MAG: VWA domain-containing protein, partial [Vallitaleaceae bacterium]|nr:VWA domain-containing protein [Vallitaleaceae bacterium]